MKFLVVDDSAAMRRIVINSLQRIGYTDVVEAEDGAQALELFGPEIGVVLTDWNMPVMNGLELVKAVRSRPQGGSVPIVMVTTRSAREEIVEAIQAGATNYIVKPLTPKVLKKKLEQVLSNAAAG